MNRHTPGPWKVDCFRHTVKPGHWVDEYTIHTEYINGQLHGPTPIVTLATSVDISGKPLPTVYITEANARLIAAAPELLDALENAAHRVRWLMQFADVDSGPIDQELSMWDSIMAKAQP